MAEGAERPLTNISALQDRSWRSVFQIKKKKKQTSCLVLMEAQFFLEMYTGLEKTNQIFQGLETYGNRAGMSV